MKQDALRMSIFGAVVLASTLPANADSAMVPSLPSSGHFSVTPTLGTDFTVGGDFVKSGSQSISNASLFGAAVTGTSTFSASSRTFNDVYDVPIDVGLSGNYGLTDADEVSAGLRYLHASGKSFNALNASTSGTINGVAFSANAAFQGEFNDYNEFGLEGGYKHFFTIGSSGFHPYLGGLLGAKHTGSIALDLSYDGTPVASGIGFFKSGWSWSAGLVTGFRYDIADSVALGLETGIRYEGDLRQNSADINSASAGALANVNSGGNRWEIPLLVGLTAKF
jgi:hypothetical protein